MNKISKAAGLSRISSNNCIRATAITVVQMQELMQMTSFVYRVTKNVQRSSLPYQQSVFDVKKSMTGDFVSFGNKKWVPGEKTPQKDVQALAQTNS